MTISLDIPSLAATDSNRVVNVLMDFKFKDDDNDDLMSMINKVEFVCEKNGDVLWKALIFQGI